MGRLNGGGARRDRVARIDERRERFPVDGDPVVGEPVQRGLVAGQRRHRLAAVARDAGREHRLILDIRIDAEAVDPRDVGGGEDAGQSRMAFVERCAVADREARVRVRRAHHAQPQRTVRRGVRAEEGLAGDLSRSVHARESVAHVSHRARFFLPAAFGFRALR